MTLAKAFLAVMLVSCPALGHPAWASDAPPVDVTFSVGPLGGDPISRERVLSAWSRNTNEVANRVLARTAPEALLESDGSGHSTEAWLSERGVLPTAHDWPSGCTAFREGLVSHMNTIDHPGAVEGWLQWWAVYQVTCPGAIGHDVWEAPLVAALDRMDGWATARFSEAVPRQAAVAALLRPLPEPLLSCLVDHHPDVLREGLDRHEGLVRLAKECKVSGSAVFGSATWCADCGPHPRRRPSRLREALVVGPGKAGWPAAGFRATLNP